MTLQTLIKSPTTNMNMDWQILSQKLFFRLRFLCWNFLPKITFTRDPLELRTLPELHHNKLSAAKNPSTKIHKDCVQAMPINPVISKSHTKLLPQNTWAQYNICNHNNKTTFTISIFKFQVSEAISVTSTTKYFNLESLMSTRNYKLRAFA
jgi:hypothetical protein